MARAFLRHLGGDGRDEVVAHEEVELLDRRRAQAQDHRDGHTVVREDGRSDERNERVGARAEVPEGDREDHLPRVIAKVRVDGLAVETAKGLEEGLAVGRAEHLEDEEEQDEIVEREAIEEQEVIEDLASLRTGSRSGIPTKGK